MSYVGGGFLVLGRLGKTQRTLRDRRGYHGLRMSSCRLSDVLPGGGGGPVTLTRIASGIVFYDDFNRADGSLGGSWTTDTGTWAIVSNQAKNTSGANFDRCRNTSVSLAAGIYEARMQATNSGQYAGLRFMAPSSSDDFHQWLNNGTDNRLANGASTDQSISGWSTAGDGSFHVVKCEYIATRDFYCWLDHVLKVFGGGGAPFHSSTGPTAAAGVGFMSYNGQSLYDWILVSSSKLLTVTGLSGTQGFRFINSSSTILGSSGTQSSGSATLDIATLVDGLTNGHVQVYDDAGTWAVPTTGGRYPSVGESTDLCGGDTFLLS